MVASGDVVDISLDPIGERRRRRRQWLRIGLPIAGVLLMIATILVIAFYSARSNEVGALLLSRNLIATLDDRIALEVSTYLDPPAKALHVLEASLGERAFFDQLARTETLAASLLRELPQIDSFSLADADGNYALFRRDEG